MSSFDDNDFIVYVLDVSSPSDTEEPQSSAFEQQQQPEVECLHQQQQAFPDGQEIIETRTEQLFNVDDTSAIKSEPIGLDRLFSILQFIISLSAKKHKTL